MRDKIVSYLQLSRAHTAPLEIIPATLGALLATEGQINTLVILWSIYGLLYHLAGYSMNSILDWEGGYDKNDPHKQHHPLNRGSLSLLEGKLFGGAFFGFLCVFGVGLAYPEIPALIFLLLGAIAGVAYNTIGKEMKYKSLIISFAHTTVFIVPYLAMGGDMFAIEFRLASVYVYLWVLFQIAVSGDIKDILELDESNFLRDNIGVDIKKANFPSENYDNDILVFSRGAELYTGVLKALNVTIGGFIFLLLADVPPFVFTELSILWLVVFGMMAVPIMVFTVLLVRSGRYYRSWRINMMARIELLTLTLFVAALYPAIGMGAVVTLMVGSVVWVLMLNQIEWGRWLAPDV